MAPVGACSGLNGNGSIRMHQLQRAICNIECTSTGVVPGVGAVSVPEEPKYGLDSMAFEGPGLFVDSMKLLTPPTD